ncbi:MAG TPA: hypothetical protein VL996_03435 [Methylocella sp.]|nr:hypothetical protein [Methylocella sp.]
MEFDMRTLGEAITSLKTATEIVNTIKGLWGAPTAKKEAEDKISELQGIIFSAHQSALSAQMAQFSMLQTVRDLETKIAQFETWDREKTRYIMKDVNPGRGSVLVYELKPGSASGEPAHCICAKCYQHRLKSPLQALPHLIAGHRARFCPECKTEYMFGPIVQENKPAHAITDN